MSVVITGSLGVSMPSIELAVPVTVTTTPYTVAAGTSSLIFNEVATTTITLPSAVTYSGQIIFMKTIAAYAVNSASSNVVPISTAVAGTAILTNTAGKWAILQSDGTNWVIMASN